MTCPYSEWFKNTLTEANNQSEIREQQEADYRRCLRREVNNNIASRVARSLALTEA